MSAKKAILSHTALIIPDGRTRIYDKYPEFQRVKVPAKDMFIGKMSTLCQQYAMEYYPDNWYILTTNDNAGESQLVRYDEKIDWIYDNPPYPIPGVRYGDGPYKGLPKYWKPLTDHWEQLKHDVERLEMKQKYSRIHFLGNGTQSKQWKQKFWDDWIQKRWDGLTEEEQNDKNLEIYKVYKSEEYEYTLYVDIIKNLFGDTAEKTWLEFPLLNCKTKPEMISRITDALYRQFPLRNSPYSLERFTVRNLFRMNNPSFTYENIPLKNPKRIQILTAPNGFGKSTIFRLLRAVLRGNLKDIAEIPFDKLELAISNQKEPLIVSKSFGSHDEDCVINISSGAKDADPFTIKQSKLKTPLDPGWNEWKFDIAKRLSKKIAPCTIRFLSSDRLWYDPLLEAYSHDILTDGDDVFSKPDKTRIEQYAASLSQRIEGTLNDYASNSHEIDTVFPLFDIKREDKIIRESRKVYPKCKNLNTIFEQLHAQREFLENIDFLPYRKWYRKAKGARNEEVDPFQFVQKHDLHKINTLDYQDFLNFYLDRQSKKYSVFNWLSERCKLFTHLVNSLFIFTQIRIERDTGFSFYQVFTPEAEKGMKEYHDVEFNQLSSGEKHQAVILYDLIFNCDPGTLILIDEPEISLHIVWQEQFIKNIEKINKNNELNFLVATHSPFIINSFASLTYDLEGDANG